MCLLAWEEGKFDYFNIVKYYGDKEFMDMNSLFCLGLARAPQFWITKDDGGYLPDRVKIHNNNKNYLN
jgi:hypothetical protein